ncbi:hypothetical protein ASF10_03945 [Flavobacterium sp. Leaf82]|jgi:uncharacterized phage-associated protein|uniref:hypothetical protein n=1 Tax=unclassified Flavobacterium TaxID=196869 RepID=UPI0006F5D216|nr:hypothetical protein [Flavobacterium sp. Leaf82]KQO29668.1 hypothetical protein ASF10_03945 [Flavobacterium sp. Leaf82]
METINIFKNIVFELRNWYIKKNDVSVDLFNDFNDFTILKIIKLHFFVVTINSENQPHLLDQNTFHAMPYGPVETNVYDFYKSHRGNFDGLFTISNEKIIFTTGAISPEINPILKEKILKSIEKLEELEPNLITAGAGSLVELTHKWNSWKKYYNVAKSKQSYSELMPNEEIKKDKKIVNLNYIS